MSQAERSAEEVRVLLQEVFDELKAAKVLIYPTNVPESAIVSYAAGLAFASLGTKERLEKLISSQQGKLSTAMVMTLRRLNDRYIEDGDLAIEDAEFVKEAIAIIIAEMQ